MNPASPSRSVGDRWVLCGLLALIVLLRLDLFGKPFVEYFSNREVQNVQIIRLFQEGALTIWTVPTHMTETFGAAEFQLLPLLLMWCYRALECLGLGAVPAPGDADAALRYYIQIACLGRAWSLAMVALSMIVLYRLVRSAWSARAARLALGCYAVLPFSRFHDQLFLAEPTIMALSVIGVACLWRWSMSSTPRYVEYAISLASCALVVLLKVSHVFLALPIAWLFLTRFRWRTVIRWESWVFALGVTLPSVCLYLLRGTHVSEGLGDMALRNTLAMVTDWPFLSDMLRWFWTRHVWTVWTPLGAILLLLGIVAALRQREPQTKRLSWLLLVWSGAWLYYWMFAGQMSGHLYYQQPSLPVAAAFMGLAMAYVTERLPRLLRTASLAPVFAGFLLLNGPVQSHNREGIGHWRQPWDSPPFHAGLAADRLLPADARIIAATISPLQYPMFYYAHRDGWFLPFHEDDVDWETVASDAPALLEQRRREGAEFYVAALTANRAEFGGTPFTREHFDASPLGRHLRGQYRLMEESLDYVIFDLRKAETARSSEHG